VIVYRNLALHYHPAVTVTSCGSVWPSTTSIRGRTGTHQFDCVLIVGRFCSGNALINTRYACETPSFGHSSMSPSTRCTHRGRGGGGGALYLRSETRVAIISDSKSGEGADCALVRVRMACTAAILSKMLQKIRLFTRLGLHTCPTSRNLESPRMNSNKQHTCPTPLLQYISLCISRAVNPLNLGPRRALVVRWRPRPSLRNRLRTPVKNASGFLHLGIDSASNSFMPAKASPGGGGRRLWSRWVHSLLSFSLITPPPSLQSPRGGGRRRLWRRRLGWQALARLSRYQPRCETLAPPPSSQVPDKCPPLGCPLASASPFHLLPSLSRHGDCASTICLIQLLLLLLLLEIRTSSHPPPRLLRYK